MRRVRYLLLSDVHANRVALDAVLADASRAGWDEVALLGDLVGYYAQPEATVARLRDLAPRVALLGNHDAHVLALLDGSAPPAPARPLVDDVLARHAEALSDDSVSFLRGLAERHVDDDWEAVHGALVEPWAYLDGIPQAERNVPLLSRRLCLVGHTHVPKVLASTVAPSGERWWRTVTFAAEAGTWHLPPRAEAFFNPGSVGQPRDGVPLAAYGLFDVDTGALQVRRVPFDVSEVQGRLAAEDYPEVLGARLERGR